MRIAFDWTSYRRVHSERRNLVIHLVAVPLFDIATLALLVGLVRGDVAVAAAGIASAIVAMALQRRGHALETHAPEPFSGPGNFLKRWFLEQFLIFPAFVLTGRWWQQFATSGDRDGDAA